MPLTSVNIPPGFVRGATEYDTQGRWYDGNLIRWRQGVMEPVQGWVELADGSLPFTDRIRKIFRWRDNRNYLQTIVLTNGGIWVYTESQGFVNVSPPDLVSMDDVTGLPVGFGVGPYGMEAYGVARSEGSELFSPTPPAWSIDLWGEFPVMVSSADGRVLVYAPETPTAPCRQLGRRDIETLSRSGNTTTVTTVEDHQLKDGQLVSVYGTSDPTFHVFNVVINVTSPTTFTYANQAANASATGGYAIDLNIPLNNRAVFVSEERHLVLLQAGGEARRVAWSSREDWQDWDFESTTNTAGFIDLQSRTPVYAAMNVRNGDLIFTETELFNMRYVGQPFIYGVDEMEETRLIGPRAITHDSGVAFWWSRDGFFRSDGSVVQPIPCPVWNYIQECLCPNNITTLVHSSDHGELPEVWWFFPEFQQDFAGMYVIYNWLENWWSFGRLERSAMSPAIGNQKPMMGDREGKMYTHDVGWLDGSNTRVGNVWIESAAVRIPPSGERGMEIKQAMVANGFNYDTIKLTFFGKQTPHGEEREFGPYRPRPDGYIDTRVTARDLRMRVDMDKDGDWSLGEVRLDVGAGSRR